MVQKELDNIRARYKKRENISLFPDRRNSIFSKNIVAEREGIYESILRRNFSELAGLRLLEIGAGEGSNLNFFHRLGIPWNQIYANELLENRSNALASSFPEVHLHKGNALGLDFPEGYFDVVFQSTVFTSILDPLFKKSLAEKMLSLVKSDGIILWYDFTYNNPSNKDVKGVSKKEMEALFSKASSVYFSRVTLAPPIGRRVGSMYSLINRLFPFLRTHIIAEIHK